jgi:hypothetical protein
VLGKKQVNSKKVGALGKTWANCISSVFIFILDSVPSMRIDVRWAEESSSPPWPTTPNYNNDFVGCLAAEF